MTTHLIMMYVRSVSNRPARTTTAPRARTRTRTRRARFVVGARRAVEDDATVVIIPRV